MSSPLNISAIPARPGIPFEGGFFGGLIRIGDGVFAVAWSPKAGGELDGLWLDSYKDVAGAASHTDSMANTLAMAEAGSDLASRALAATIGGKSDWCLPARDVLELGYRYLKPGTGPNLPHHSGENPSSDPVGEAYTESVPGQTDVRAFQRGGGEEFGDGWCWSSTQHSSGDAWGQNFEAGYQSLEFKTQAARTRLVRLIPVAT